MTTEIRIDKDHYLEVGMIGKTGDFVSGLSISYQLRRSSDDILISSGSLTEETNVYTALVNISVADQYRVIYITPSTYENGMETLIVNELDLTDIKTIIQTNLDKTCKILGLVQSNYVLTDQDYSPDGCLLSAVQSIYGNATDAQNQVTPLAQYQITASYTDGLLTHYISEEI
jgi:hypothetical protein